MAGFLDSSTEYVRCLVKKDLIPGAFRVGRLIRFKRDLVDAWLAARVSAGQGGSEAGG